MSRRPVGGYKIVYQYADLLARRGRRVIVWHSAGFLADEPGRGGLRDLARAVVHRLRNARQLRPGRRWFSVDDAVELRVTVRPPRIRLGRCDAVIGTAAQTMSHAARVARDNGVSVGLIQHYETWGVDGAYVDATWREPDDLIVIAPWLQEHAAALGLHSRLLPNAMDAEAFPRGPALGERAPRVVAMLSHLEFKRPDLVCAVLGRLADDGISAIAFGQMPRPAALPSRVEYVENPTPGKLREIYQSAVVYLCASDAEGWHLPPAEATLSGAAVVSTDIGGVRASLESDALYAPVGDEDALVAAVRSTLADRAAAQARVDSASARLRARTPEHNADELLAILDDLRKHHDPSH